TLSGRTTEHTLDLHRTHPFDVTSAPTTTRREYTRITSGTHPPGVPIVWVAAFWERHAEGDGRAPGAGRAGERGICGRRAPCRRGLREDHAPPGVGRRGRARLRAGGLRGCGIAGCGHRRRARRAVRVDAAIRPSEPGGDEGTRAPGRALRAGHRRRA